MSEIICWGFNPGQWAVKNTLDGVNGKVQTAPPFPAVIAPWAKGDDLGLQKGARQLEATVERSVEGRKVTSRYLIGTAAQYMPNQIRQMAVGRLDADSPIYPAFVQGSFQHTSLNKRRNGSLPTLAIASALPIGWKDADAEKALEQHIKSGLKGLATVKVVYVKSEPAAVILHEMIDDDGVIRREQSALGKGVVCVADIGGSTLNHSILDGLQLVPGQSHSPYLGSYTAIKEMMQKAGLQQAVDAERMLLDALKAPGSNPRADAILAEYGDTVIATLQQAWKHINPTAYLIAGGTALWIGERIKKVFGPKVRIVAKPQQAIATGLYRFAKMQLAREAKR